MKNNKLKIEKFFYESAPIALITNGIRLQRTLNASLREFDVSLNQALILLAIFFEPQKVIRSHELLKVIPTTKGNISHCTSFLEQKKLLLRHSISNDLRGFEFTLSSKGLKLCIHLIKFFNNIENKVDDQFSSQKLKEFINISYSL